MSTNKKFAVILSGCGVYDGAEIHEATLTMYAIAKAGAQYQIFAPDIMQHHVVNHLTGEEMNEKRNVLVESARIARGNIKPLKELKVADYDAVVFPGGFGAAKNLSTFAFDGENFKVNTEVERVIKETVSSKKPLGALCISPIILSKVLDNAKITLGTESDPSALAAKKLGAEYIATNHGDVVIDENYNVFTSPCYMLDATIDQIGEGAENVVREIMKRLNQ
ncbi:MAG: isoprenoid biosynthesis glyoxalase ElbB [Chlorobi bacterium]|nr:isoprenoid biosynthesis glyoxalase ElbB [Chlorobiota bacterium]